MNKLSRFLITVSIIGFILFSQTGCLYDINTNGDLSNHTGILTFVALCGLSGIVSWFIGMPIVGTVLLCFVLIG